MSGNLYQVDYIDTSLQADEQAKRETVSASSMIDVVVDYDGKLKDGTLEVTAIKKVGTYTKAVPKA